MLRVHVGVPNLSSRASPPVVLPVENVTRIMLRKNIEAYTDGFPSYAGVLIVGYTPGRSRGGACQELVGPLECWSGRS